MDRRSHSGDNGKLSTPDVSSVQYTGVRLRVEELFRSDHLSRDLAGRTARGGLTTIISQASQFAVQAGSVIVLARLLTPADYGVVGMVAVFIGLAQVFKAGGLAMGTVQSDEISHEQISTVFWMNVGLLTTIGLTIVAAAPLVARFYQLATLAPVTAVLGLAFVVNGLSVQHDALLRRHMRFVAVAITQVVPLVLSLCVSVVLALEGWHYWALVCGTVVTAISSTALSFYLCPWVPSWMRRRTGARHMLRFGRDLTLFNAFNYFARNSDSILIGRFIGAAALGLYSRAYSLFLLPMGQIRDPLSDVSMPALSALKHQPERYVLYYRRFLGALALATVPLSVYFVLEGDFLIRTLLGPQWVAAALVFRILAAAGIVQTIASTHGLVLVSLGHTRKYLWWGIANSVVMTLSFVIGLRAGIVGVATSYAVANYLILVPTALFALAGTPIKLRVFFGVLVRPLVYAGVASLVSLLILALAGGSGFWVHVLVCVVFFGTCAVLASRSGVFRETWAAFAGGLRSATLATGEAESAR